MLMPVSAAPPIVPVKSKHSSCHWLPPSWVSSRSWMLFSSLNRTGTDRRDQTFMVKVSPWLQSTPAGSASVLPPNTWSANFSICTTWALVLMPPGTGFPITVDTPPPKPPPGPKSNCAGSPSKSTLVGVPPPPPPPEHALPARKRMSSK
jgi:hypothetical protein